VLGAERFFFWFGGKAAGEQKIILGRATGLILIEGAIDLGQRGFAEVGIDFR